MLDKVKSQQTLHLWQFQVQLTPFSEFFSNFPHGTFLLLRSHRYLAFDDANHRFVLQYQKARLIVRVR